MLAVRPASSSSSSSDQEDYYESPTPPPAYSPVPLTEDTQDTFVKNQETALSIPDTEQPPPPAVYHVAEMDNSKVMMIMMMIIMVMVMMMMTMIMIMTTRWRQACQMLLM